MHTEVFVVKPGKATTVGKVRFLFAEEISISGLMRVNGMLLLYTVRHGAVGDHTSDKSEIVAHGCFFFVWPKAWAHLILYGKVSPCQDLLTNKLRFGVLT
jgi:hypothetical protein